MGQPQSPFPHFPSRRRRLRLSVSFRRPPSTNMAQLASSDGSGPTRELTDDELAEMERSSEAYDEAVGRILDEEEEALQVHVHEVMSTGTTTITEVAGTFQMTLKRPRWRSGELVTEGHRAGRGTCSWTPVQRQSDTDSVAEDVPYRLAQGVVFLREG